jgi:hypothetical protein
MDIENEQIQKYIHKLNTFPKENIEFKKEPEYSLEEYGKGYNSNLKANLDPNTTAFNKFLKDNEVLDTYYEKNQSYYNLPKSTDVSYPKHFNLYNKLKPYEDRMVPGEGYIDRVIFRPGFNDNY